MPLANRVRPWTAAHERHGRHGCVFAKGNCPGPSDAERAPDIYAELAARPLVEMKLDGVAIDGVAIDPPEDVLAGDIAFAGRGDG